MRERPASGDSAASNQASGGSQRVGEFAAGINLTPGDREKADVWLRVITAIATLGTPATGAPRKQRHDDCQGSAAETPQQMSPMIVDQTDIGRWRRVGVLTIGSSCSFAIGRGLSRRRVGPVIAMI